MEDVIFAGTAAKAPLGRAEVILTIDNTDGALPIEYAEVTISRIMFRTGGSEYAINGRPCRLLDVQELLSDSGIGREMHVVVGQGQLDAILHATPIERRGFIEEAAGVLKHRKRKEKALRKLEAMGANLTRLEDLTTELRRQLKPLGKQAEVARRASVIQADLRDARLRLLADDLLQGRLAARARAGRRDRAARAPRRGRGRARPAPTSASASSRPPSATRRRASPRRRRPGTGCQPARAVPRAGEPRPRAQPQPARGRRRGPERSRPGRAGRRGRSRTGRGRRDLAAAARRRHRGRSRPSSEQRASRRDARSPLEESRLAGLLRAAADRREGYARLVGQRDALRSRVESAEAEIGRLQATRLEAAERAEPAQREFTALESQGRRARRRRARPRHRARARVEPRSARRRAAARAACSPTSRSPSATGPRSWPARRRSSSGCDARTALRHCSPPTTRSPGCSARWPRCCRSSPDGRPRSRPRWAPRPTPSPSTTSGVPSRPCVTCADEDGGRAPMLVSGARAARGPRRIGPTLPAPATYALDVVDAPPTSSSRRSTHLLARVALAEDLESAPRPGARASRSAGRDPRRRRRRGRVVVGGSAAAPSLLEVQAAVDEATADLHVGDRELRAPAVRARRGAGAPPRLPGRGRGRAGQAARVRRGDGCGRRGAGPPRRDRAGRGRGGGPDRPAIDAGRGRSADAAAPALDELDQRVVAAGDSSRPRKSPTGPSATGSTRSAGRCGRPRSSRGSRSVPARSGCARCAPAPTSSNVGGRGAGRSATAPRPGGRSGHAGAGRRRRRVRRGARAGPPGAVDRRRRCRAAAAESARRAREEELTAVRAQTRELATALERLVDSVHRDEVARAEQRLRVEALETKAVEELGIDPDTLLDRVRTRGAGAAEPACCRRGGADDEPVDRRNRGGRRRVAGPVRPGGAGEADAQRRSARSPCSAGSTRSRWRSSPRWRSARRSSPSSSRTSRTPGATCSGSSARSTSACSRCSWRRTRTPRASSPTCSAGCSPAARAGSSSPTPTTRSATGVDVEARPAGKRVKRLSLLSGGERSLTAVALLVAIFKARPEPVLRPGRGRGGARRHEPRPAAGHPRGAARDLPAHRGHPPEAHDGDRRRAVRRDDARRRRDHRDQPAPPGRRPRLTNDHVSVASCADAWCVRHEGTSRHRNVVIGRPGALGDSRRGSDLARRPWCRAARRDRRRRVPRPGPTSPPAAGGRARRAAERLDDGSDATAATDDEPDVGRATAARRRRHADLRTGPRAELLAEPEVEAPESAEGRLVRLRARLARSQSTLGRGPALAAVRPPGRRGHLGAGRGDPPRRRRRRRARRWSWSQRLRTRVKVLGSRDAGAGARRCCARSSWPRSQPDLDRTLRRRPRRGPPGGRARRRRQRHGQDHDRRQDRPDARRPGQGRPARCS